MKKRTIGIIGVIVGVILTLLSVFADYIRLGSYAGINWAQIVGIVAGLVVVAVSLWLIYSEKKVV